MQVAMAYKFKLVLSGEKIAELCTVLGATRSLYNCALAQRSYAYRKMLLHGHITDKFLKVKMSQKEKERANTVNSVYRVGRFNQDKEFSLKDIKNNPDLSMINYMACIPKGCAQQKLLDLDKAFSKLKKGEGGYPKFKRGKDRSDSIRFPAPDQCEVVATRRVRITRNGHVRTKGYGFVDVPKFGKLKFLQTREMKYEKLNSISIKQEGKDLFVVINVEKEISLERGESRDAVGIDRNANGEATLALSNGKLYQGPLEQVLKIEGRIKVLQARMRTMKKGSKTARKAYDKTSKLHLKKSRIISDWQHKATTDIAKNHSIVGLENLGIKRMTKSSKGTKEKPGKKVAQKSGLNLAMLRFAHSETERQLLYKVSWRMGWVLKTNPHYTSIWCSECGERHETVREGREFICLACGSILDADVNGAKNVKLRVDEFLAGRDSSPGVSVELLASVCDIYAANKSKRRSRNQLKAEKRKLVVSLKPNAA